MQRWGESYGKISENIRLWGPRGGKGLPAGNKLVFGQRETADGVWIPVLEPSPGPRRKNTVVSNAEEAGFILTKACKSCEQNRAPQILGENRLLHSGLSYPCFFPC